MTDLVPMPEAPRPCGCPICERKRELEQALAERDEARAERDAMRNELMSLRSWMNGHTRPSPMLYNRCGLALHAIPSSAVCTLPHGHEGPCKATDPAGKYEHVPTSAEAFAARKGRGDE